MTEETVLEYLNLASGSFVRGIFGQQEEVEGFLVELVKDYFMMQKHPLRYSRLVRPINNE